MNNNLMERRLRDALAAQAQTFSASPDAWQHIQAKDAALSGQRRGRPGAARTGWLARHSAFMLPTAAAATVVVLALGVTVLAHGFSGTTGRGGTAHSATGKPTRSAGPRAVTVPVSIALSPAAPASAHELATAANLISERVARSGLPVLSAAAGHAGAATVSGGNVILTGRAADKTALEGLTGMGVLRFRHVLLEEHAGGAMSGDARLVHPGLLTLFRNLACNPGESDTAWQQEAGYTTPADWNDPAAQVVSCSNGTKYVLDAATVVGQEVTGAVPVPSQPAGQWGVVLTVNTAGASAFGVLTTRLYSTYYPGATTGNQDDLVLDQVAAVLDGTVVSAPEAGGPVTGGQLEILGNPPAGKGLPPGLTRAAATELAAELQSGPLPVAFRIAATSTSG